MLLSIGTRVKFLHSSDQGTVTSLLGNGMVNVLLDDDEMEIPVYTSDLIRADDVASSVKAKIVSGKKEVPTSPTELPKVALQYKLIKDRGIQLAFEPIGKLNAPTEYYNVYLINTTRHAVIFTTRLYLEYEKEEEISEKLEAESYQKIGELLYDELNKHPSYEIECCEVTTEGKGASVSKTIKIKPKTFFNKSQFAPLINNKAHVYKVFETLKPKKKNKGDDLVSYTKALTNPPKPRSSNIFGQEVSHDLIEMAEFSHEIDLHLDKLVANPRSIAPHNILHTQLAHFETYIDKAIRLGVDKVFIIHGVGEGKLRDAVARSLRQNLNVQKYKNEFHPKYGYGATEVLFY